MFGNIHLFVRNGSFSRACPEHSLRPSSRTPAKSRENRRREVRIRCGTHVPGKSACAECDTNMTQTEHQPIPVRIAYVGGGSLNWAPVL
ncbi:hypothetical protein, partial [Roseicyclus sp.]|uniref:hypothetical protein n=1 Tax=Roseicyclus sp. TaxID=1914329 RepID=UPI003FA12C91